MKVAELRAGQWDGRVEGQKQLQPHLRLNSEQLYVVNQVDKN